MKFFTKLKNTSRKLVVVGVLAAAIAGFTAFGSGVSADVTLSTVTDCNTNAVIYCGATSTKSLISSYVSGNTHNSAKSIQDIYNYFGINSTEVKAMNTTAVAGYVTKSGDVYAGSQLVATNALTAGRSYIAGSTKVTSNGTTFYTRKPSVSFVSNTIKAYVVMVDGKFSFAILGSCGNPVKATAKTPAYNVTKEVRVKGQSAYQKAVTVQSGTHVEYRVTVSSTGAVPAVNILARDTLPTNTTYVDNTLARDGVSVAADSNFFGSAGNVITSLAPGKSVVYTFEAIIGAKDTVDSCTPQTLTNTGLISSPGLPNDSDTANVNKTCAPKPVYSCDNLNQNPVSRTNFNFTAKATANNGAVITGYVFNFGDNSGTKTVPTSATTTTVAHSYAAPGNYKASVTVLMTVNGTPKQVNGPNCETNVTVQQPPTAECSDLKLTANADRTITATVTYRADNGVTLKNAHYDFGDQATIDTTNTTVTHTYAADGSYTVKATLSFNSTEAVADSTCQASIGINSPAYSCDLLNVEQGANDRSVTINDFKTTATGGATYQGVDVNWGDNSAHFAGVNPIGQKHTYAADGTYTITATATFMVNGQSVTTVGSCTKQVSYTSTPPVCKYNPNLPADSKECQPPQVLVNTGAGSVFGIFAAATIVGVMAHRLFLARRLGRQ